MIRNILISFTLTCILWNGIGGTRHVVYWYSVLTPILNKELSVKVEINDWMDVLCPYIADDENRWNLKQEKIYLHIYNVTQSEYLDCDTRRGIRLQSCDEPEVEKKLTTKFQVHSPSPFGFKFVPGATYYYLSKPLHEQSRGCTENTMRMTINVMRKGKASPPSHHENTRTYHTIKTDHRNSSKNSAARPVMERPDQIKRHHHHQRKSVVSTVPSEIPTRKMAPEVKPVVQASRDPDHNPGSGASALKNTQRTISSISMIFLSLISSIITCIILTDFDLTRNSKS